MVKDGIINMDILGIDDKYWNKKYLDFYDKDFIFSGQLKSEHSEAAIIECIFKKCLPVSKYFVDIGAYGERNSNTFHLAMTGWQGIMVEANVEQAAELRTIFRGRDIKVVSEFVTPGKLGKYHEPYCLEAILDRLNAPKIIDFLSIDIDSYEYEVWKYLIEYTVSVVCIEINQFELDFSVIDYDPSFTLFPYKGKRQGYGGTTLGLMNKLAEEKGYDFLCLDICNAFYIKKNLYGN